MMIIGITVGFLLGFVGFYIIDRFRERIHFSAFLTEISNKPEEVKKRAHVYLNKIHHFTDEQLFALPVEELNAMYERCLEMEHDPDLSQKAWTRYKQIMKTILKALTIKREGTEIANAAIQIMNEKAEA
jgi:hypothetical protein